LKNNQFLFLLVAIGLIGLIYFFGPTKPPQNTTSKTADHAITEASSANFSFDSLKTVFLGKMDTKNSSAIKRFENQLADNATALQSGVYDSLIRLWKAADKLNMAAFYFSEKAKLENSEKNLNFAGQLHLDLMHEAPYQGLQVWEAKQAINCFEQSLQSNPNNDTVKMALASCFIQGVGETMKGVQILLGIVKEHPDHIPANILLGKMAVQSQQFDKAIVRLERLKTIEPKNTEILYFLAEAYKGKGEKEKAIVLFEQCKKLVNNPAFSKDIDTYINSFK